VIRKRLVVRGLSMLEGEGEELLLSELYSLATLNGLPTSNLKMHVYAIASKRPLNPVVDYFELLRWDGVARLDGIGATLVPGDSVAPLAFRLFSIAAAAIADAAVRTPRTDADASNEYITVLIGPQGGGKTKGPRKLLPKALREFFRGGHLLDLKNKDSIKQAISAWVCELGGTRRTASRHHRSEGWFRRIVKEYSNCNGMFNLHRPSSFPCLSTGRRSARRSASAGRRGTRPRR
jgi:hypothetical protein